MRRAGRGAACALALCCLTPDGLAAPVSSYRVVRTFPHSTQSYTEGFLFRDGLFYEGTGLNGNSALLVIDPDSARVLQRVALPPEYFGEGISDFGGYLFEWTWQSHIGFVYDRISLRLVRQFSYRGEGWGMTHDARQLITSDGTATLRFRNPADFRESRHVVVHDGTKLIDQLNELEFVKGEIYANVWHTDLIAHISPSDGHVLGWIDLTGLLSDAEKVNGEAVLNGIAYDAESDRLFVTGKQWPTIFEIRLTDQPHLP